MSFNLQKKLLKRYYHYSYILMEILSESIQGHTARKEQSQDSNLTSKAPLFTIHMSLFDKGNWGSNYFKMFIAFHHLKIFFIQKKTCPEGKKLKISLYNFIFLYKCAETILQPIYLPSNNNYTDKLHLVVHGISLIMAKHIGWKASW